jgi:hypothetical protein
MIKQPSVYRNPPDPGFVGGYNWSAMFVGLLLLMLVNIGATQFVAYRLEYHPPLAVLYFVIHSIRYTNLSRGHPGCLGTAVLPIHGFVSHCCLVR